MKTGKKVLALLLTAVLVLSLTACGSLKAVKTVRKVSKLESVHADLAVDLDLGIGMFEEELMAFNMTFGTSADVNREPLQGAGVFRMALLDEEQEGLFYFAGEDDSLMLYTSADGGETWSMHPVDLSSFGSGSGISIDSLLQFRNLAAGFEETGTEMINGYSATVYAGSVSGEELKALMEETDVPGALAEATEQDPEMLQLGEVGSIPITVAIDEKTDLPVEITVDLSEMMQSVFPFFLQVGMQASAESSEETEATMAMLSMMDFTFHSFMITVQLSDFDQIGTITIPEEVLTAAVPAG